MHHTGTYGFTDKPSKLTDHRQQNRNDLLEAEQKSRGHT